jgi:hypothetical protein
MGRSGMCALRVARRNAIQTPVGSGAGAGVTTAVAATSPVGDPVATAVRLGEGISQSAVRLVQRAKVLIPARDAIKPGIKNVIGYPAPDDETFVAKDVADEVPTVTNTIEVLPERGKCGPGSHGEDEARRPTGRRRPGPSELRSRMFRPRSRMFRPR